MASSGDKAVLAGITGGIGSGKSVVSRILRLRGFTVYDCDYEAKKLRDSSPEICQLIRESGFDGIIKDDGSYNTEILRKCFFSDNEFRHRLNNAVHTAVRDDLMKKYEIHAESSADPFFVESAIMNTSGIIDSLTLLVVVSAPEEIRIERVKERSGIKESQIKYIMQSQIPDMNFDNASCSIVALQNVDSESLLKGVDTVLNTIININKFK